MEEQTIFYFYVHFKDLIAKYCDLWEKRFCEKGTFLFEIGKTILGLYFCESGIVRTYSIDKESGEEITNRFLSENDPIIPFANLAQNVPMVSNVHVIEAGWFYFITKENFKIIMEKEPNIKDILLEEALNACTYSHEYQYDSSRLDFQDWYELWREKYPYLSRIPDEYVGSLFGVHRVTINRAKKELIIKMKKAAKPKK